jgi:hypothetical protein
MCTSVTDFRPFFMRIYLFKYLNGRKKKRKKIDRPRQTLMLIHVFASHRIPSHFHPYSFFCLTSIQMHIFIRINALSTTLSIQSFAFVLHIYFFLFGSHQRLILFFWLKYTHQFFRFYSHKNSRCLFFMTNLLLLIIIMGNYSHDEWC